MRSVYLHDEGFPETKLFEDGTVVHIPSGRVFALHKGRFESTSKVLGYKVVIPVGRLLGKYFNSPFLAEWTIRTKNLAEFGCSNYVVTEEGEVFATRRQRYILGNKTASGYRKVVLMNDSGGQSTFTIHGLVAKAMIPNPENKPQVNHIDGNKENNRIENLEWVDSYENITHARDTGLRRKALDDSQVKVICELLSSGKTVADVAREVDTSYGNVRAIMIRSAHKRISEEFAFNYDNHRASS